MVRGGTNCALDNLEASDYPRLRRLDLSQADFSYDGDSDFVVLAKSSILPQLEHLSIKNLEIEETDEDRDPLAVLAELVPRFAHLELYVEGDIIVEGADDQEVDRILSPLGLYADVDDVDVD